MTLSPRFRLSSLLVLALAAVAGAPAAADAGSLPNTDFVIRRGDHNDSTPGNGLKAFHIGFRTDRTLTFRILFTPSTAYTTRDPSQQADWNKVMGFTTAFIHQNSIRLGWRWLPAEGKMELGFYGYAKGRRIDRPLAKVALDTWADVSIRFHRGGLAVTVNGVRHEHNQSLGFSMFLPTTTWVLMTAYFGGNETAPQYMMIRVANIQYR